MMTVVTIEYCVPCGFFDSAVDVQTSLIDRFGTEIGGVTLQPGNGGVFEVRVDGETIWDRETHGAVPDHELILDEVEERLAAGDASDRP